MNENLTLIAADSYPAQGGDEHLSERTSNVRERRRAGANAAMGRNSER
uniref:Uncharacterized protein n=1 Tax=uncultured Chloroflexi bacterium Rifle_16ft_4_minimus_6101 TaxID=1665078 RepID=A0A0H4TAX7_9CHLR|nr:hypothetical protein [uncultured Chloroflexi bacterium Rifle_16ft_4_minimus_6101]